MNMSKPIRKAAITLFAMSAMLFSASLWPSPSVQVATGASPKSNAAVALGSPPISITVSVWFGRASKGCRGWGICKIPIGKVTEERTGEAELSTAGNGKLQLTLLKKAPEEGRTLFVDEDIPLSQEIAEKLGVKNATIRKGQYAFGKNKSLLNARLTR
jgi:hypothetical protein